jgi:hypothetical protein
MTTSAPTRVHEPPDSQLAEITKTEAAKIGQLPAGRVSHQGQTRPPRRRRRHARSRQVSLRATSAEHVRDPNRPSGPVRDHAPNQTVAVGHGQKSDVRVLEQDRREDSDRPTQACVIAVPPGGLPCEQALLGLDPRRNQRGSRPDDLLTSPMHPHGVEQRLEALRTKVQGVETVLDGPSPSPERRPQLPDETQLRVDFPGGQRHEVRIQRGAGLRLTQASADSEVGSPWARQMVLHHSALLSAAWITASVVIAPIFAALSPRHPEILGPT